MSTVGVEAVQLSPHSLFTGHTVQSEPAVKGEASTRTWPLPDAGHSDALGAVLDIKIVLTMLIAVTLANAGDDVDDIALVGELCAVVIAVLLTLALQQPHQQLDLLRGDGMLAKTLNQLHQVACTLALESFMTFQSTDDVFD